MISEWGYFDENTEKENSPSFTHELIAKINPYPIKVKNKFDFIDIGTPEDYQYAQTKLPDLYPLKK